MSSWEDLTPLQKAIIEELRRYEKEGLRFNAKAIAEKCDCRPQTVYKVRKKFADLIKVEAEELRVEIPEVEEEVEEEIEEEFEEIIKPEIEIPEVVEKIEEAEITDKDVEKITDFIMDRLVGWTGWEGWRLTEEEKKEWCPQCAYMINKYVPDILAKYFPEILFTITTLTIFGGRALEYKKIRKRSIIEEAEEKKVEKEEIEESKKEEKGETKFETTKGEADFKRRLGVL